MPHNKQSVDGFIFSILNGNVPSWPGEAANTSFAVELEQALHLHGLHPLIHHLCKNAPAWKTWPAEVRERLKKTALHHAASDLAAEDKTRDLLTKLQAAGLRPIVLKGTAIAYTHYDEKSTRTCGDIDLLFHRRDMDKAFRMLETLGYAYVHRQGYLGQELGFADMSPAIHNLPLDIHWRSSSYVLLGHVLEYDEILRSAISLPALAPLPCTMNPVHALLHACIHWIKHVASGDSIRILWIYDIHLLVAKLSAEESQQFVHFAARKKISLICRAALLSVNQKLPCDSLSFLASQLEAVQQQEPSARMLEQDAPGFTATDLFTPGNSVSLLRSLQDVLLPPGAYGLRFYGRKSPLWLPLLYAHRLSTGLLEYTRRR